MLITSNETCVPAVSPSRPRSAASCHRHDCPFDFSSDLETALEVDHKVVVVIREQVPIDPIQHGAVLPPVATNDVVLLPSVDRRG